MGLYKYRIIAPGTQGKAEHIAETRAEVEHFIPHGEQRLVKRYQGTRKLAAYHVERDMRGGVLWTQLPKS